MLPDGGARLDVRPCAHHRAKDRTCHAVPDGIYPGVAQHVVQRGNDRQPCFFTDIDRIRYLQDLHELSLKLGIAVHAYVLMTNHVHLLLTSQQTGATSTLMQSLGRRYVRYINTQYRRTGTLWEGRYKSCPVQGEIYLLRCYR
jgi:putative transposase